MNPKVQTTRPFEERVKSGVYNFPELSMLVRQLGEIEGQVIEPQLRNALHSMSITQADILLNGASN